MILPSNILWEPSLCLRICMVPQLHTCSSTASSLTMELEGCLLHFRHSSARFFPWELLTGDWKVGQREKKVSLVSSSNRNSGSINIFAPNNHAPCDIGLNWIFNTNKLYEKVSQTPQQSSVWAYLVTAFTSSFWNSWPYRMRGNSRYQLGDNTL